MRAWGRGPSSVLASGARFYSKCCGPMGRCGHDVKEPGWLPAGSPLRGAENRQMPGVTQGTQPWAAEWSGLGSVLNLEPTELAGRWDVGCE